MEQEYKTSSGPIINKLDDSINHSDRNKILLERLKNTKTFGNRTLADKYDVTAKDANYTEIDQFFQDTLINEYNFLHGISQSKPDYTEISKLLNSLLFAKNIKRDVFEASLTEKEFRDHYAFCRIQALKAMIDGKILTVGYLIVPTVWIGRGPIVYMTSFKDMVIQYQADYIVLSQVLAKQPASDLSRKYGDLWQVRQDINHSSSLYTVIVNDIMQLLDIISDSFLSKHYYGDDCSLFNKHGFIYTKNLHELVDKFQASYIPVKYYVEKTVSMPARDVVQTITTVPLLHVAENDIAIVSTYPLSNVVKVLNTKKHSEYLSKATGQLFIWLFLMRACLIHQYVNLTTDLSDSLIQYYSMFTNYVMPVRYHYKMGYQLFYQRKQPIDISDMRSKVSEKVRTCYLKLKKIKGARLRIRYQEYLQIAIFEHRQLLSAMQARIANDEMRQQTDSSIRPYYGKLHRQNIICDEFIKMLAAYNTSFDQYLLTLDKQELDMKLIEKFNAQQDYDSSHKVEKIVLAQQTEYQFQ